MADVLVARPVFLLRPKVHFDNQSYELAVPRPPSSVRDDDAQPHPNPPPPAASDLDVTNDVSTPTSLPPSCTYPQFLVRGDPDVIFGARGSEPELVVPDPLYSNVFSTGAMPRASNRKSGGLAAVSSLSANDVFFIAGGIERPDVALSRLEVGVTRPDVAASPYQDAHAPPRPQWDGGGTSQGNQSATNSLRANNNNATFAQDRLQGNHGHAPLVSTPSHGSGSHVAPTGDGRHARAKDVSATSRHTTPTNSMRIPPTNEHLYDQDEDNSLRGRILSPSTGEDEAQDCAACHSCSARFCDCLRRIPCASTIALVILFVGLGGIAASILIAVQRTREIFVKVGLSLHNRTGNIFNGDPVDNSGLLLPLDLAETFILGLCVGMALLGLVFLVTAFVSSGISRRVLFMHRQSRNLCGRAMNGGLFSLAYVLAIGWIGTSGLLSLPIFLIYVFRRGCTDFYMSPSGASTSWCVSLHHYGVLKGEDFKVCGKSLARLCADSQVLYPAYISAYVSSVVVVVSLIHFLVTITANYAHIKKDKPPAALFTVVTGSQNLAKTKKAKLFRTLFDYENAYGTRIMRKDFLDNFRDDICSVMEIDNSNIQNKGNYIPSNKVQTDLLNYWLQKI